MKSLLLLPLLLGLIPSANAGVYYYPDRNIKVNCHDGQTHHLVEYANGKIILLKGHGKEEYKTPNLQMKWPYGRYANSMKIPCSYREITTEELSDVMAVK